MRPEGPRWRTALHDAALRVLAPAVVLFAAIVAVGLLITGPLGDLEGEDDLVAAVQGHRSLFWDAVTDVWSRAGNTEVIIGTCIVGVLVIWWRTRRWWVAIVPAIAISVQATVFVVAAAVVGRDRPHVSHLDPAPPTSSYPSGHVGAAVALYVSFAVLAQGVEHDRLRRLLTVALLLVPSLVAVARVYRGMHHPSDILIGVLNGLVCAYLATHWRNSRQVHTSA